MPPAAEAAAAAATAGLSPADRELILRYLVLRVLTRLGRELPPPAPRSRRRPRRARRTP